MTALRRQRLNRVGGRATREEGRAVRPLGARLALLVAAVCVPGMLMLVDRDEASADSSSAGPVSSGSYRAAVAFADTEHAVPLLSRMFGRTETPGGSATLPGAVAAATPANKYTYFGELELDKRFDAHLDLRFKVEGRPDAALYRYCRWAWSQCRDTEVRVLPSKGLLYFWNSGTTTHQNHWPAAFAQQRLEVSASDADSGLKVYREVLVNPPPEVQGCEDYGDDTVEAFVCLYLREVIPDEAGGSNEATLRAGLPGLVQDASNYELVFAEEFDGSPPAPNSSGCSDGLSTLDDSVWNYNDPCEWVDAHGESCNNIANGEFIMAAAYRCGTNLNTRGKLHYKYGYLEYKYTVNADRYPSPYHNYNLIAFASHDSRQNLWKQYGGDGGHHGGLPEVRGHRTRLHRVFARRP